MKKLLAVLLSVILIFSAVSTTVLAAPGDIIGDIMEDYLGVTQEEGSIDQQMMYGVHYEMEPISLVGVMYKPNPTITFKQPVMTTVTTDTPISIDYEFLYWRHAETGEVYNPGDAIEVTGVVTLYAVWQEKTDNYPKFIRAIISGFEVLNRLIQKFLGVFDSIQELESEYNETTTVPATV